MSKLLEKIQKIAEMTCQSDEEDFNAYDYSGGNFDDAFWNGVDDGKVKLAREILPELIALLKKTEIKSKMNGSLDE